MKTSFILAFIFLVARSVCAQKYELIEDLKEISGIEQINDHTLIAINDGGNSNELFVLSDRGKLLRRVVIGNSTNEDWEDIAVDDKYAYVADFGNNLNKRKDLCVYKVRLNDIAEKDTVRAEKISFSYAEQNSFPPQKENKYYDAEALICLNDKMYILTKTNNDPWTGECIIYEVPKLPGSHELSEYARIKVGEDGWYKDAITAADEFEGRVYFSTYDRIVECDGKFGNCKTVYRFEESTQKESLVVTSDAFFVADERQIFLGGGYLYKIDRK